ncbi:MAG: polyribonucleotide nucleotidyltransferase, partial [Planctomycetes bacterium]|nr:polyribonucleotide nucleotidyltransferase [Planctomycetota bacterium]
MLLGGRKLIIESGRLAKQAAGSALVTYGETVVLSAVVEGPAKVGADIADYLPLTVDYREKTAAAGKFPGGFIKREGRPSTKEILSARLIDRPIRPLFPAEYCNELQVYTIVFSADNENDPDVVAQIAASAALSMSGIPFQGPIGSVRVGRIDGQFVVNPPYKQLETSELELVVSGTANAVLMVEGAIKELTEDVVVAAIQFGHDHVKTIVQMQRDLMAQGAKPVRPVAEKVFDPKLLDALNTRYYAQLKELLMIPGKQERYTAMDTLRTGILAEYVKPDMTPADALAMTKQIKEIYNKVAKRATRDLIFEGKRSDGRAPDAIRPIWCTVSELPRTHGSAVFTRGETQALVTVTLGTTSDQQVVDGLQDEYRKRFMLHYNFPAFSVNEVKRIMGPGRREIGHGMLAERALEAVLPDADKFPYTIRIISDILESNGSSSMASVCGGTMALLDAGAPLKAPVAGIAMGLVKDGDRIQILSDILG